MYTYKFCPKCGDHLDLVPRGEQQRLICRGCAFILYRNPIVGVAVILMEDQKILLGRRSRGEYAGHWCIPCGYVEWGEVLSVEDTGEGYEFRCTECFE